MKKFFSTIAFVATVAITFTVFSSTAAVQAAASNVKFGDPVVGFTYTKYPIVLVGGILDYDMVDYFHGVESAIERDAKIKQPHKVCTDYYFFGKRTICYTAPRWQWDVLEQQDVHFIYLNPLEETVTRGQTLAIKIDIHLQRLGEEAKANGKEAPKKVHIIAHSHGATTSRVAVAELGAEKVASLTTIAGPHFGTASADAATLPLIEDPMLDETLLVIFPWLEGTQLYEEIENWASGWQKQFVYGLFNIAGYFVDGLTNLAYVAKDLAPWLWFWSDGGEAHIPYKQDMQSVADHFIQEGIEEFNTTYPSAGLPYREDEPDNIPHTRPDTPSGMTYGGQASYNGRPYFGKDFTKPGALAGDGRGKALAPSNENAILYYSWTGKSSCPNTFGGWDPLDLGMMVTHGMSQAYYDYSALTAEQQEDEFGIGVLLKYIIDSRYTKCKPNETIWFVDEKHPEFKIKSEENLMALSPGDRLLYLTDEEEALQGIVTDSFIPVSSARFGDYISTFGPWNHMDEQNQLLGFVHPDSTNPLTVYRTHANRLKNAGR